MARAEFLLRSEGETLALARDLAATLTAGDLVTLSGDLGAGKTTLARGIVRTLLGSPDLEVPSPTFTLIQAYAGPRFPIVHADLYRISGPEEMAELGWDEAACDALVLVEWPDHAGAVLATDRLDVALAIDPDRPDARIAVLAGFGSLAPRLERMARIRAFLDRSGWGDAARQAMHGDASARTYERLFLEGDTAVLMNAPARPDGPPVRGGKPYSAIAHLAETVVPFAALARGLQSLGLSAPRLYAEDLDAGLIVLEDFGAEGVISPSGTPIPDRYACAVDVLAHLHALDLPAVLPVSADRSYPLPPYDAAALEIELDLLLDWYVPHVNAAVSQRSRDQFMALWREALAPVLPPEPARPIGDDDEAPRAPAFSPTWVLRDYHSPNLMWLPEREGIARIGLLDFQDAVLGHPAYDLGALLFDARVDVPESLEIQLLGRYVRARRAADRGFDAPAFVAAYATLSAQRLTKILGIFARLHKRDGKPAYLAHLPRIRGYLDRALAHPVLSDLRVWYQDALPRESDPALLGQQGL